MRCYAAQMGQSGGGWGLQLQQVIEHRRFQRRDWRGLGIFQQGFSSGRDFVYLAQADQRAGCGDQINWPSRSQSPEQCSPSGCHGCAARKPVEQSAKPLGSPDMPQKRRLALVRGRDTPHRRHQDANIPSDGPQLQTRQQAAKQRKHLGIGAFGRLAVKNFKPHLQAFTRRCSQMVLGAKHFAAVAITRRVCAVGHMGLHDRHGKVRA